MKITKINIENIKGFVSTGDIEFSSNINLLLGPNNSGKSTVIKSCYLIQNSINSGAQIFVTKNRRIGSTHAQVKITFDYFNENQIQAHETVISNIANWERAARFKFDSNNSFSMQIPSKNGNNDQEFKFISNKEPNNLIYPFFSKRKSVNFNESFNRNNAETVNENLVDIYAKIDKISNIDYPANKEYRRACKNILGFHVSCSLSDKGKQAGIVVSINEHISIDEMGEGTANLLGLIVDLCVAENKIFLIEELENDIHPKALKALLDLIIEKSNTNQFIVSTHSNIVTKHLGSVEGSKIFYADMKIKNRLPHSQIKEVKNTPQQRIKVLEDLGYDMYDFELWKAYLILEESSAERIIRDILIPTFTPNLVNKLKTIAAQGADDIEPRFHDFLRLFVFVHLSNAYKNKAWVIADGDQVGKDAIKSLQSRFNNWKPEHFKWFSNSNFEEYYPDRFQKKAKSALSLTNKKRKFKAKGDLVKEVIEWSVNNKPLAKKEFKSSASEVIDILKELDSKLK